MSAGTRHKQALARYKLGTEALAKQALRETEDLKFQIPEPEFQWAKEAREMRAGSTVGNVAVSAKPMLCIPKLDQPIQLVLNQEKAAHLGVQVHALSEEADDDTADVLQGIYRRIEVDSRAGLARSWAYERAVKCGRGAYRVLTEYANDGGHYKDQKIVIKRLLHQESVVLDPFAEEPDWSDGRWGFIVSWMPWDRYTAKFPKSKLATSDPGDLADLLADQPSWMKGEGEGRAVLVAEYFCLEYENKTRVTLDDGTDSYDDAIPEGKTAREGEDAQPLEEQVPSLKWSIMNGYEILKEEDRDGRYIPIIPTIGREMIPFDQERRWQGIISTNKDGARMFNYAASQAVTVAALEPLAPFILDPRQIEKYETQWGKANTSQQPYLPVILDPNKGWVAPQRTQIDAGRLGPSMMLIQQADSFLHAGTGAFESALGQASPQNKTKGGILALQQQQEQSNSHFLDNLAEISITYEAKVVLDLIPFVYDRPGRVVRTLDLEDNNKTVMLNQPFTMGQNGRPQAAPQAPAGALPPQGMVPNPNAQQGQPQPKVLHYDLKKGRYGVVVSVGNSYQNRAQQGKDELGQVFAAWPEGMQILGDLYFKFADFPGHREASERMKKLLPPALQDHDNPQKAEQELAQAKAQMQQMQQVMQQMADDLKTDKVKADAQIQIAAGKQKVEVLKIVANAKDADKDRAVKLYVAELEAKAERLQLLYEGLQNTAGMGHEEGMAGAQAAHELQLQREQHAQQMAQGQQAVQNDAALAEQGQAHTLQQGDQAAGNQAALAEQGQAHTLEQGQQAADLAPDPKAGA